MATALVSGVIATIISFQGLAGGKVDTFLEANSLKDVCSNVPRGQPNRLINSGIQNPDKDEQAPFLDASTEPAPENVACNVDQGPFKDGGSLRVGGT